MNTLLNAEKAQYLFAGLSEATTSGSADPEEKLIQLSGILDEVLGDLTNRDGQFYSSRSSRLSYIVHNYQVPEELERDVLTSINFLRHRNKKKRRSSRREILRIASSIARLIEYFSSEPCPPEFKPSDKLSGTKIRELSDEPPDAITLLRGSILSIEPPTDEAGGIGRHITIRSDDYGDVGVLLTGDSEHLADHAWLFACVHLFSIVSIEHTPREYVTTSESIAILEPDFLVDATAIADCFLNSGTVPLLSALRKFIKSPPNESVVVGSIVNFLFDEILKGVSRLDYETLAAAIRKQSANLLVLKREDPEIEEHIRSQLQRHSTTLLNIGYHPKGNATIEPTFISPEYGIQGRLDLMDESSQNSKRKAIIELKSGKAPLPEKVAWENHKHQIACYDMLLETTFPGRIGTSSILYSQANDHPLRNVVLTPRMKKDIARVRNGIVFIDHSLAFDPGKILRAIRSTRFSGLPSFLHNQVIQFESSYSELSGSEQKLVELLTAFQMRELWIRKAGGGVGEHDHGFAALWNESISDKLNTFSVLPDLRPVFNSTSGEDATLDFEFEADLVHSFRPGDIIIMYPMGTSGETIPTRHQLFKGTITSIGPSRCTIRLRSEQLRMISAGTRWAIEHDVMESGTLSALQSLFRFMLASTERKLLLLGSRRPRIHTEDIQPSDGLTVEQTNIVSQALGADDYFLIQGPPGTGKTSIIVKELAFQLCHKNLKRVLFLTFTNRAADEICEALDRITPDIGYFRLGTTLSETLRKRMVSSLFEHNSLEESSRIFDGTRAIVSTVASYLIYPDLCPPSSFDVVIVDEASQLLDVHLLGILSEVPRFILIGDEKQLPSVVQQSPEMTVVKDPSLKEMGFENLRVSIFERLIVNARRRNWEHVIGQLRTQGRMHVQIADFSNLSFYNGILRHYHDHQAAGNSRFDADSRNPMIRALALSRVLFVSTPPKYSFDRYNTDEAELVGRFARLLAEHIPALKKDQIGIITPFRAQIAEIRKQLSPEIRSVIDVDTVERFQGMQRDSIILSFAINHPGMARLIQGLSADNSVDRKLNVALTRAKEYLILVGCATYLRSIPFYDTLIRNIQEHGNFYSSEAF